MTSTPFQLTAAAAQRLREDVLAVCATTDQRKAAAAVLGAPTPPQRRPLGSPCHICRRPTVWRLYGIGPTCDVCLPLVPASCLFGDLS